MGQFDGRVALVTGAARGQGRAHAIELGNRGADVVACDLVEDIATVPYPLGSEEDLEQTVALVESTGSRCLGIRADIRDSGQVQNVVDRTVTEFGRIDILVANAGVCGWFDFGSLTDEVWDDMVNTNLSGTFRCMRAVLPHMMDNQYGRIIVTASDAARKGIPNLAHYAATKWGVVGLAKSLALETAQSGITVNVVCPTTTQTPMVMNDQNYRLFCPDIENPTLEDALPRLRSLNPMNRPWMPPEEVSRAVMFLASDEGGYVSGATIEVSMGAAAERS